MSAFKSCKTCKHCDGDVMVSTTKCVVVFDPVTGTPLPARYARMDTWSGFDLPCGYRGNLYEARDAET